MQTNSKYEPFSTKFSLVEGLTFNYRDYTNLNKTIEKAKDLSSNIQTLKSEGSNWTLLPLPCRKELFPNMKNEINARVKYREEFRPFAPSVLSERASELFFIKKPFWY